MITLTKTELQWLWNAAEGKKEQLSAMLEDVGEAEALIRHHIECLGLVQDKLRAICDSDVKRIEITL